MLDYRDREYNFALPLPVDTRYLAQRGLFAEVTLDRYELEEASATEAFFGYSLTTAEGEQYHYSAFPINEVPPSTAQEWKQLHYRFEIHPLRAASDQLQLFIWNKGRKPFYVDNVNVQLYRIADL